MGRLLARGPSWRDESEGYGEAVLAPAAAQDEAVPEGFGAVVSRAATPHVAEAAGAGLGEVSLDGVQVEEVGSGFGGVGAD